MQAVLQVACNLLDGGLQFASLLQDQNTSFMSSGSPKFDQQIFKSTCNFCESTRNYRKPLQQQARTWPTAGLRGACVGATRLVHTCSSCTRCASRLCGRMHVDLSVCKPTVGSYRMATSGCSRLQVSWVEVRANDKRERCRRCYSRPKSRNWLWLRWSGTLRLRWSSVACGRANAER